MKTKIKAWPNESGKRNLKDIYDDEPIDTDMCQTVLLLASEEIDRDVINSWTEDQRRHAANWAFRVYLRASDNAIEQLRKPEFLSSSDQ